MSAVRRRGTPEKRDSRRFIPGSRKKDFSSRMKIPPLSFDPQKTCGMPHVLKVAFPLIMASAGHALNLFCDRMMLGRYSAEAVAAAMPSGLTNFTISCFFIGTVGYVNSFVAQYTGAGQRSRVGDSIWQAVLIALIGGLFMASGYFWGGWLMTLFGHTDAVLQQEIVYFKLLSLFAWVPLLIGAFGAFWSGRGLTLTIMIVNFVMVGSNIPFNYAFIYGNWGAPELGIRGAAYGTILSGLIGLVVYLFLIFRKANREVYGTWPPRVEFGLFKRILRYGAPNGVQLLLELSSFNIFIILLGNVGADAIEKMRIQEATTIAFSLNSIAFIPMLGLGQTISILVGQSVGAGLPAAAKRAVANGRFLVMTYMTIMTIIFAFCPGPLLSLFVRSGDLAQVPTMELARTFVLFIAMFTFCDGVQMLYVSAIKGAGDTAFAMWGSAILSWVIWIIPSLIAMKFHAPVNFYWGVLVFYTFFIALVFYLRFRQGKWRKMCVIERELVPQHEV